MNPEHFPTFVRVNYGEASSTLSDEYLVEAGTEFKEYLEEKFNGEIDKLDPFWDINPVKAMMDSTHPLKTNGYHPALIIHFDEFLKLNFEKSKEKS